MNKHYEVNEELAVEAEEILESIGLDLSTAVRVMLKRVIKEQNINFLLASSGAAVSTDISAPATAEKAIVNTVSADKASGERTIKMTKSRATALFASEGCFLSGETTFASSNKASRNYWANPSFEVLSGQWNLILNDWHNRMLYLFVIPADSIRAEQLVARGDNRFSIDLQILYDDRSFTDIRSKMSFAKYLVKTANY